MVVCSVGAFWSNVQLHESNITTLSERGKIRTTDSKMRSLLVGNYHVLIFLALGPAAQEVGKFLRE